MATLFVRHHVADHAEWRRVYDGFEPTRQALGVTADAVYQAVGDPNDITVTHEFASVEAAQAFAASPDLHAAMEAAGVQGAPTLWFTSRA